MDQPKLTWLKEGALLLGDARPSVGATIRYY
jgi:hypothetical protein